MFQVSDSKPGGILFCSILFIILLYVSYKNRMINRKEINVGVAIGALLVCLFSFWGGDYYHYLEIFESYKVSKDIYHMEEAYLPIFHISPNYIVFRLIIWGGAFALLYFSCKLLKIKVSIFFFSFVVLYLFRFSYARISLAIAMIMFAYSIVISRPKIKALPLIIGIIIMYLAIPFHKSSVLAVVGIIMGLFCLNRRLFVFMLIVSPFFIWFLDANLYTYIIDYDLIQEELTLNAFNLYTQSNASNFSGGLGSLVFRFLEIGSIYYLFFQLFYLILVKKIDTSRYSLLMFSATAGFIYLATCFSFLTPIIFRRILYMSMAPMAFSFSIIYDKVKDNIGIKVALVFIIIYQTYNILYNYRVIGLL